MARPIMRIAICLMAAGLLACLIGADDTGGWTYMFDGQTLDGWKAGDHPESWSAKSGEIVGDGGRVSRGTRREA